MATFISDDRSQALLLPPDLRECKRCSAPHAPSDCVVPGQELIDIALHVPADDSFEGSGQVGVGFDVVQLRRLDQRCDDAPVSAPTSWPRTGASSHR